MITQKVQQIVPTSRAIVRAAGLASLTMTQLGAVTVHQKIVPKSKREQVFDRHMRLWVSLLLKMFGVKVVGHMHEAKQHAAKARLIVSNHRSPIDIALVLKLFGGHVLSRADLSHWPILGTAARKAGTIFVDRSDSVSGAQAVRRIRKYMLNGATVTVFPEGTTYQGDEVHEFMRGAFVGIRGLDVQVIPVGIAYEPGAEFVDETFVAHLKRTAQRAHTRVALCVGQPQDLTGKTAQMAQAMQQKVQQLVYQARADLEKTVRNECNSIKSCAD